FLSASFSRTHVVGARRKRRGMWQPKRGTQDADVMTITKCAILEFLHKNPAIEEGEPVAFVVGVVSLHAMTRTKSSVNPRSPKSANIMHACGMRGSRWRKGASPLTFPM